MRWIARTATRRRRSSRPSFRLSRISPSPRRISLHSHAEQTSGRMQQPTANSHSALRLLLSRDLQESTRREGGSGHVTVGALAASLFVGCGYLDAPQSAEEIPCGDVALPASTSAVTAGSAREQYGATSCDQGSCTERRARSPLPGGEGSPRRGDGGDGGSPPALGHFADGVAASGRSSDDPHHPRLS